MVNYSVYRSKTDWSYYLALAMVLSPLWITILIALFILAIFVVAGIWK